MAPTEANYCAVQAPHPSWYLDKFNEFGLVETRMTTPGPVAGHSAVLNLNWTQQWADADVAVDAFMILFGGQITGTSEYANDVYL